MDRVSFRVVPNSYHPELSLPLTVFDIVFFKFNAIETTIHYALSDPSPANFYSTVLPQLQHSLSLTLDHFLPLAGRLVWPEHEPKPLLLYRPNDGVSFTVAKAHNPDSFPTGGSDNVFKLCELRALVPELSHSDNEAEPLSIQITYFENNGVAIGFSFHHAVFDGASAALFLKAWAASNSGISPLPNEHIPSFDRKLVKDFEDEYSQLMSWWYTGKHGWSSICEQPRSLKLAPRSVSSPSLVLQIFNVSIAEIERLKVYVLNKLAANSETEAFHVSTVVVLYALTIVCLIKSNKVDIPSIVIVPGDHRGRLGLQGNYFGNCVLYTARKNGPEMGASEDAMVKVVKEVSQIVKDLKSMSLSEALKATYFSDKFMGQVKVFTIGGSQRFGFYKIDFGWGKPLHKLILSEGNGNVFIVDRRDGDGVQIQLVLEEDIVEVYSALFEEGLDLKINDNGKYKFL